MHTAESLDKLNTAELRAVIFRQQTDRAALLAALTKATEALDAILSDGDYDGAGDYVLPHGVWDGVGEPPDISDPVAIDQAGKAVFAARAAIAQAEAVQS